MLRAFQQVGCFLLGPPLERIQNCPGPGQGHLRVRGGSRCAWWTRGPAQAGKGACAGQGVEWGLDGSPAVGLSCHKLLLIRLSFSLCSIYLGLEWPLPAWGVVRRDPGPVGPNPSSAVANCTTIACPLASVLPSARGTDYDTCLEGQ